jgi:hypothetical protein
MPVSRNREIVNQLSGILRKRNKKRTNIYIYRHTVCMLVCMIVSGPRTNQSQATNCQVYSENQETESKATRVRYTTSCQVSSEKIKKNSYRVSVICLCGARVNQRHTRHHRSSGVCECSVHVRERASVCAGTISLISLLCLFVCRCTP